MRHPRGMRVMISAAIAAVLGVITQPHVSKVHGQTRPVDLPERPGRPGGRPRTGAVPANPNAISEAQPDGTKVTLYFRGGERGPRWYEDERGYAVTRRPEDRGYVYAVRDPEGGLVPTPLLVGRADPALAGLKKGIRPKLDADPEGGDRAGAPSKKAEDAGRGRKTTRRDDPRRTPDRSR